MPEISTKKPESDSNSIVAEPPSAKEQRIRAITRLYYSNPKIQEAIFAFSAHREVVPRYFEGFGKRPDTLTYPSDIMGLVNRGATSFHASEEIWSDPLKISADLQQEELSALRTSWDLLIDIDSPFLDCSRIAALLVLEVLESHGVKNYGIKFSGSKGFHIIVSGVAFPDNYDGQQKSLSFPVWPRAICGYILHTIRGKYNAQVTQIMPDVKVVEQRTGKKKEDLLQTLCPECGRPSEKRVLTKYSCPDCHAEMERPEPKSLKGEMRCIQCPGKMQLLEQSEFFFCPHCKAESFDRVGHADKWKKEHHQASPTPSFSAGFSEQFAAEMLGGLDIVLVSPRHLFRMPYSLHEKTSLASAVISKSQITTFTPKDANPLTIAPRPFLPPNTPSEASYLLSEALAWKKEHDKEDEREGKQRYAGKTYEHTELKGVTEAMFPVPIKKLLLGLQDGKKRGLFILITFLASCSFTPEKIQEIVAEWNKKNSPPLKEGYIRSQLDWHFRQKKRILPPNYDNDGFYKDLGLLASKPTVKNPIVEVARAIRRIS